MKISLAYLLSLLGLVSLAAVASPAPRGGGWTPVGAEPSGPEALKALVKRRLPASMQGLFTFVVANTTAAGHDAFSVTCSPRGGVTVTSATTPGLARGLLEYLRKRGGDIFWSGDTFDENLTRRPAPASFSGSSWAEHRYFLNVVTYSYTTAFYDWEKWEYLLDWAVLHGVTLPLAVGGQEYIWAQVYRDFGLPDSVILPYFSGPAFHSWQRMGNIHGSWGGNVTQDWLDKQWALQQKIVARMLAFGMKPVLPGFAGFVIPELHDKVGGPAFIKASRWNNLPDSNTMDTAVDTAWDSYNVIQSAFLNKQKQLYGGWTSGYYSIDLYTELRPSSTDPAYLKKNSASVINSLKAVDPSAVWVMQGWNFVNDQKSWTLPAIEAYLSGVDDASLLILDLASESMPVWSRANNFYGKKWIWNTLLNYGMNNGLYGALDYYNSQIVAAQRNGGKLAGQGITPEGLNQNEALFEMAMDTAWTTQQINVGGWIKAWIARRYGLDLPARAPAKAAVEAAWDLLARSVYNSNDLAVKCTTRSIFDLVPGTDTYGTTGNYLATKLTYKTSDVVSALDKLLAGAAAVPSLAAVPAFSYDLVDVARQALLNAGIPPYQRMLSAWKAGNTTGIRAEGATIISLLNDTDTVLATDKNFLLAPWISSARAWGATPAAKDFMEYQARNQISTWGPGTQAPWTLDRYAAKHWAGVVKDLFAPGWQLFIDHLATSSTLADFNTKLLKFEQGWERLKWTGPAGTTGSPVPVIKDMRAKWSAFLV